MAYYPYHVAVSRNVRQALVPASGCSIEIFVSGTGTHRDLYQDELGQIPLANPIIADVDGEVQLFLAAGRIRVVAKIDPVHEEVWEDVVVDADGISGGGDVVGFKKNEQVLNVLGSSVTASGLILHNTQGYAVTARVLTDIEGAGVTGMNVGVAGTGMANAFTKNGMGITTTTGITGPKDIKINSPFNLAPNADVDVILSVLGAAATGGTVKLTYHYLDFSTT